MNGTEVLQRQMKQLQGDLLTANNRIKMLHSITQVLETEKNSASNIIWAMAHANGGRVDIPDSSMAMSSDVDCVIELYRDKENQTTVIKAKMGGNNAEQKGTGSPRSGESRCTEETRQEDAVNADRDDSGRASRR